MPDLSSSLRELIDGSATPIDVDAIVRARRRRRMRRRGAIVVAAAVVVAVVAVGVIARPTSQHDVVAVGGGKPSEADATRDALSQLTLLTPGGGSGALTGAPNSIKLTDPQSGATRAVALPFPAPQSTLYPFIASGSHFVMLVNTQTGPYDPTIGTAYAFSSDMRQWRALAPASGAFAAGEPDRLWLVSDNATPDQRLHGTEYGSNRSVFEIGVDGNDRSDSYPLTDHRTPVADTGEGLLTSRPAAAKSAPPVYEVWDPATDRVVRRLAIGGYPAIVSGRFAAWTADDCTRRLGCNMHLTDLRTGADRIVAPPRGLQWGEGAFSPDGSHVALVAAPPPTREQIESNNLVVPSGTRDVTVVDVDAVTGREVARSATVFNGALSPSWSPDGSLIFFARDLGHLAYFNPSFKDGPVRSLAVRADLSLVVEKTAPPSTTTPRYSYDGRVSADASHSAELCIYPTALVLSPSSPSDGCGGPLVGGWDPKTANGSYHLVGTYDGQVFTLTQPPSDVQKRTAPKPARLPSGCVAPPGGWKVTDRSKLSFDTYTAVTNAARAAPDFAGIWVGPYLNVPGVVDANLAVINMAFTGNIGEHRRALAALYGGPICVVQRPRSYAELQRVSHALIGAAGKQLGLQMIAVGPDDLNDVVHAEAVAATPAIRRELDQRYGAGTVDLTTALQPLG